MDIDQARIDRLNALVERVRVPPGSKVVLERDHDPGHTAGWLKKTHGAEYLALGKQLLADYQDRLAAQQTYGLLVVLQGIDASGKDGTIKHVMSGVNPQGVTVTSFKAPSGEELEHDYLWRQVRRLPGRGQIGIFNRSHYEEVLVVRVHPELLERERLPGMAAARPGAATVRPGTQTARPGREAARPEPKAARPERLRDVWARRYREINDWERYLIDNGFRVVKLFLNISREEQRKRFLRRIDRPDKNWKFSADDVAERQRWDEYQLAFSEMLSHTSTEWAPWYVIPANRKWFGRILSAAVIIRALAEIDPQYPTTDEHARQALDEARVRLEAEAQHSR
jgi:PPK2 family polyphosphate:nucleotide phosphotransferase